MQSQVLEQIAYVGQVSLVDSLEPAEGSYICMLDPSLVVDFGLVHRFDTLFLKPLGDLFEGETVVVDHPDDL